ncbi:6624_t:CDS:2, partial [Rhizophagus irregularis]
ERNYIREDLRTFGNIMLGHDIGNDWNALVPPADTIFGRINQVETRVGNLAGPVNRAAKSLLNRNNVQNNNTQDVRQNDNGKNDKRHGENEDLYVRKTTEYRNYERDLYEKDNPVQERRR